MDEKTLTEADIRTKFITPALVGADGGKWNVMTQLREEIYFTRGQVIVRGKTVRRGDDLGLMRAFGYDVGAEGGRDQITGREVGGGFPGHSRGRLCYKTKRDERVIFRKEGPSFICEIFKV